MYTPFNLKIDLTDIILLSSKELREYTKTGCERKQLIESEIGSNLKEYVKDGVIDGSKLSDEWFKTIKSDVFISYSHNDEEIAMVLSGYLEKEFGLNIFVDSFFWGSADALLKDIDDTYCKKDCGEYDYQKSNFSTSHVHAMLSTAIIKVMDQSEIVIFLNTDNSIPKVDNTILESYTQSPWIYEEIIFASLLRKRHWSTHRSIPMYEFAERKLQVEYRVPLLGMKEISIETIVDWKKKYDTWLNIEKHYGDLLSSGVTHPLNCLYKMLFGEKE
jgi:hypothetical protein